jgi:hypothetical protein
MEPTRNLSLVAQSGKSVAYLKRRVTYRLHITILCCRWSTQPSRSRRFYLLTQRCLSKSQCDSAVATLDRRRHGHYIYLLPDSIRICSCLDQLLKVALSVLLQVNKTHRNSRELRKLLVRCLKTTFGMPLPMESGALSTALQDFSRSLSVPNFCFFFP